MYNFDVEFEHLTTLAIEITTSGMCEFLSRDRRHLIRKIISVIMMSSQSSEFAAPKSSSMCME